MARRSHHSIGEVLSLLQDDFPDVTISKIRFLESQGLISPERTPSGYRRFFQRDLDLLRWILTQQRDHYLPLKVIREKLAAGEPHGLDAAASTGAEPVGEAAPAAGPQTGGPGDRPAGEPDVDADTEPAGSGVEGAGAAPDGPAGSQAEPTPIDDEVVGEAEAVVVAADDDGDSDGDGDDDVDERTGGGAGGEATSGDGGPTPTGSAAVELLEASEAVGASEPGEPAGPGAVTTPEAEGIDDPPASGAEADDAQPTSGAEEPAADDDADGAGEATADDDGTGEATSDDDGTGEAAAGGDDAAPDRSAEDVAATAEVPVGDDDGEGGAQEALPEGGAARAPGAGPRAGRDVTDADGPRRRSAVPGGRGRKAAPKAEEPVVVALTRDELAEASGCPVPVLNDLERFGLLQGKAVGRGVLYDDDALVVARLAARFANHGLEPRHLRSFRLAAEREIGLFAQVVGPLLQRRDAMAHERAMETLTDLASLASELHQVLVQNLVTREFGSR